MSRLQDLGASWLRVSRDGRDTLWLLATLSLCILPHAVRLPLWCSVGAALAILWRGHLAWRDGALPPRWLLLLALVACAALTLATHRSLFGREAGITMVTLLAALKTLELRARRDAFVITSLAFFLILTQFLYSQSIGIAALMLVATLALLSTLVLAQRPLGRPSIAAALSAAARCLVMGIPVMLTLYVLFPRFGPLWSLPADAGPRTGLSDRIQLGRIAELAQDDNIALRVRFLGPAPAPQQLYFRGPVLDRFDGVNWLAAPRAPNAPLPTPPVHQQGTMTRYQLTLEPLRLRTMPLLEGTLTAAPTPPLTQPVLSRSGLSWLADKPQTERAQIDGQAWLNAREDVAPTDLATLREWTALPAGFNPRTLIWAVQLRNRPDLRDATPHALAQAILAHIRSEGYRYTLSPDADGLDAQGRPEPHLIDQFWIDRRSGFCEHFATAFVVVMRAMEVPARVVTGFQGAEINPVDGLYVVRNSDAHAWAEYWVQGEGWVRIDPTAAVAPERIDRTRPALRNPRGLPEALSRIDPAIWGGLRAYMDAANHRWNTWVLQYSRNQQMSLLKDWGFESPDWPDLLRLCVGLLVSLSLGGVLWLWWRRPRQPRARWHGPMLALHRQLLAAGWHAPQDSPVPAPAMAWLRVIESAPQPIAPSAPHAPERHAQRLALIQALRELDALRYAPPQGDARQRDRHMRKLIKDAIRLARAWPRSAVLSPQGGPDASTASRA